MTKGKPRLRKRTHRGKDIRQKFFFTILSEFPAKGKSGRCHGVQAMVVDLRLCRYRGDCCFRCNNKCRLLKDTIFHDGRCHFQKEYLDGQNLYDLNRDTGMWTKADERRNLICHLSGEGMTVSKIAATIGVSERTVYRHLDLGTGGD